VRGKLPDESRRALETEGVVHIEERVRGAISFAEFRAPGRYHRGKYTGFLRFAVVLTERRLFVHGWRGNVVNVEWTDERFDGLELSVDETRGRLRIKVDVDRFREDWSGSMTIHLRCADPEALMRQIEEMRRG
jgi:hypothetical protein